MGTRLKTMALRGLKQSWNHDLDINSKLHGPTRSRTIATRLGGHVQSLTMQRMPTRQQKQQGKRREVQSKQRVMPALCGTMDSSSSMAVSWIAMITSSKPDFGRSQRYTPAI